MKETVQEAAKEMCEAWGMEDNHGYSVKDTFQVGFVQGSNWRAEQSPWIDFHHQMPVENQLILVQAGYRQNVIHLVTYHDGEFYENGKEVNFVGDWMPIPELPKE